MPTPMMKVLKIIRTWDENKKKKIKLQNKRNITLIPPGINVKIKLFITYFFSESHPCGEQ